MNKEPFLQAGQVALPGDSARQPAGEAFRVLFVCLGNICRSPAAEQILRDLAGLGGHEARISADSAGIGAWHTGQLPDPRMRSHALRRHLSLSSRARQVRSSDFEVFDLIVAMDDSNWDDLRELCPDAGSLSKIRRMREFFPPGCPYDHVPDPYYMGPDGFELVLDLLEKACGILLERILSRREVPL